MKVAKFLVSCCITLALIFLLDKSWVIKGNRIPPLGKFLDPFHGFWKNVESKTEHGLNEISITGLKETVTIVYDSVLIPHIFANQNEDLYFAQGYVTATHRLWQMEFQTHAAAGRVSEITGPGKNDVILNFDRGQRRLGMVFAAEHALHAMMVDPTSRMMIENYTKGVNEYIKTLDYGNLPFEYKLLDYTPEPWTPIKCALLLKNMAQSLSMSDKDMEMSNALKLFGKDMVDILYPDREPKIDPIVYNPGNWKFKPITLDTVPYALPDELIHVKRLPKSDPTTGSNNWAVSGSKTSTGSPMLCGDPHLNLSLPSIWYAVQLNAPGINVMGASLPGSPNIIIGFTDSIAWSVTNAQRDLTDWFSIEYENSKREKYKLDGDWVETYKAIEKFSVRDAPAFYDTILYTQWGPVTYDKNYHAEKNLKDYAFRWIAHDESNEMIAFYKLNRAKNHADYMTALDHFKGPPQNFAFASVSGDIAMRIQGNYPVRRHEEGKFVLDGSKNNLGWQAFIPNEQNIMYKNPLRGFISSANQYPADSTYPYYITATHFEAYRNRRINKVLEESDTLTVKNMMKLQNDNYNLKAEESLPVFLDYLDTTKFTKAEATAYRILKSWDYYNTIDSEGASYYESWWDNLMPLIWDEMEREDVTLFKPTTYNTIKLIKEKPELPFFDIKATSEKETAGDVIRKAFKKGISAIENWKKEHASQTNHANSDTKIKWADYKDSYIGHLLRIEPLNIHVRHGGNHDIVNAHSRTHGPSWRMVVSLEKSGVKSWVTYPGGQSGNPGSKYYSNMLTVWVKEEYFPMLFIHKPVDANTKLFYSTQFKPASK